MMRLKLRLMLAGIILAGSQSAPAQDTPAAPAEDIVVQGVRVEESEIRNFIDALTDAPPDAQLPRFDYSRACPAAAGLTTAQNAEIKRRMRAVAAAANIPVGPENCRPNVIVLVTRNKRATVERLAVRYPALFSDFWPRQIRLLARDDSPVAVWHVSALLDANGMPAPREIGGGFTTVEGTTFSRLSPGSRPTFDGAVLVVEASALGGLTTTQFADYAAMRLFAETAPPSGTESSAAPSILRVLDAPMGSEVPLTLTHWDLGFLRSLYAAPDNAHAPAQIASIRRGMQRELENARQE